MGDATRSLAAEIEAVLRANTCELGQADEADRFLIVDVKKSAAEIAALQSRAFEDGARWMRERAVGAAEASTPDCDGEIYIARKIADEILALPLQPEGERNA